MRIHCRCFPPYQITNKRDGDCNRKMGNVLGAKPPARHRWTKKQALQVYNSTGGRCYYCRSTLKGGGAKRIGKWELDHYEPLILGQANWSARDHLDNLVPACLECNRSKGSKRPADFARQQGISLRCRTLLPSAKMCLQRECWKHHWFVQWCLGAR